MQKWFLIGLWILSVGLHLGINLLQGIDEAPQPGSDPWQYENYAWNLAQGKGFAGPSPQFPDAMERPTVFRTPGLSFYWSLGYRVFGRHYAVPRVMNALAFGLAPLLVYLLAGTAYGRRIAVPCAVLAAVYPIAFAYGGLSSEALFMPLWLLHLWLLIGWKEDMSWRRCLAAGVVAALAMLVRASILPWLPFVALWCVIVFRHTPRRIWTRGAALVAIPILCVLPWTLRNYRVTGEFVFLSCGGGINLLGGNNDVVVEDPVYRGYCVWPTLIPGYENAFEGMTDIEADREAKALAKEWLLDNKALWPSLTLNKLRRMWTPFLQPTTPAWMRWGVLLSYGPLLLVTMIAFIPTAVMAWRRRPQILAFHLAMLWISLIAVIFFGFARYRFPVEYLMLILSVSFIVTLGGWMRRKTEDHGLLLRSPIDGIDGCRQDREC